MGEIRLEGPVGADPINYTVDQPPRFTYGSKLVTRDASTEGKHRIYRYCRIHGALTQGISYFLSSVNEVLAETAVSANYVSTTSRPEFADGTRVCIPQWTAASPTAEAATWVQTGGFFESTGALCVSATANHALYITTTNGKLSTIPSAQVVRLVGAKALANGATVNIYSEGELICARDLLA